MKLSGHRLLLALVAMACMLAGGGRAWGATEWQSLLSEDFSQGEVSFYTGQASEAFYGIDDENRYIIDGLNTEIDSLSALTKNLYYYYVQSECELIDTRIGDMAFCGLVFHYNKKIPGKLAYYVFYIYADGYYGAKRVIGDNAEVILPLTKSDFIDIERPNVLAVDARGTRFDLYINGRYVDGFTDVRIDGGGFGFYVSQQSRAAFDNFEVKVERRGGGPEKVESPELLEGSSDDSARSSVSRDENFNGYNFPNIPKDPKRPVYPWEVGVDKSETARKERAAAAEERERADLAQRRLEGDLAEPVRDVAPPLDEPYQPPVDEAARQAEPEQAAGAEIPPLDLAAGAEQKEAAGEPGNGEGGSPGDGQDAADGKPAEDETFVNVSLPDSPAPPNGKVQQEEAAGQEEKPAADQQQEEKAEERSAEEIMREVRNSDDDWSTSAPPYRPPDEPREDQKDEQPERDGQAESKDDGKDSKDDGELKGIELPPLDLAVRPQREEGQEKAEERSVPADREEQLEQPKSGDEQEQQEPEAKQPADDVPLSLFPEDQAAGSDTSRIDASDVLGQPQNPGELKLGSGSSANDASQAYDPFEDNPDVESVYDDFTEQRWPVAEGDTSSYRYFGAAYEIDNTKSDTMAISYQQGSFTDARYGLDVEYLGGLDYVGYGLATRFSVQNGNVSYYGLFVSQSGEFLLLKVINGKEHVLRDWTAATQLSRTLSNRIGMELIGNSISCIINGEVVATVTDDSLQGGGYALLCGPGTSTRFDNLTIKGMTAEGS